MIMMYVNKMLTLLKVQLVHSFGKIDKIHTGNVNNMLALNKNLKELNKQSVNEQFFVTLNS